MSEEYEVEAIRGIRGTGNKAQYCVKWKGYRESDNTWEPIEHLQKPAVQEMIRKFRERKTVSNFKGRQASKRIKRNESESEERSVKSEVDSEEKPNRRAMKEKLKSLSGEVARREGKEP